MTDHQAAIDAAARAIDSEYRAADGQSRPRWSRDLAVAAVEAAAPHLAPTPAPIDPAMAHCAACAHRLGSGCGCGCCAWAGEVVAAGVAAGLEAARGQPHSAQLLEAVAREAVQAALPVIAAAVAAGERMRLRPATGCDCDCAANATAIERERCAALAEKHDARYRKHTYTPVATEPPTVNLDVVSAPFADLLRGGANG